MKGFLTFFGWREALTERYGIRLTPGYARERIAALGNPPGRSTAEFAKCYGNANLGQVIAWCEKATREEAR